MSNLIFVPAPGRLAPYVRGFWCAEDWSGSHVNEVIKTSPSTGGILTINVGRPNSRFGGCPGPQVSLNGIYTQVHQWQSCVETSFVMVLLTPVGLASLFPGSGCVTLDEVVELGAIEGDHVSAQVLETVNRLDVQAGNVTNICTWLTKRLHQCERAQSSRGSYPRVVRALEGLQAGLSVAQVAQNAGVSRRTLHNWVAEHLGLSPKAFSLLARLESSIQANQTRRGDQFEGYSDQAHCIRDWREVVDITPGRYETQVESRLVNQFWDQVGNHRMSGALYL